MSVAGLSSEEIILMPALILPSSHLAETALASRVAAFTFFGLYVADAVVKVVVKQGAHLTKPGWSKPHTHSTPN